MFEFYNVAFDIQKYIDQKAIVLIHTGPDQAQRITPLKVIYLNHVLQLLYSVGEDSLIVQALPLSQITIIEPIPFDKIHQDLEDEGSKQIQLDFLVHDFVNNLRKSEGLNFRLILKVLDQYSFCIDSEFNYMTEMIQASNSEDQWIWAANVERGPYLYEWLLSQKKSIELLKSEDIKEDFEIYCKEQEKRIA